MKLPTFTFLISVMIILTGCTGKERQADPEISIIPEPRELQVRNGSFVID